AEVAGGSGGNVELIIGSYGSGARGVLPACRQGDQTLGCTANHEVGGDGVAEAEDGVIDGHVEVITTERYAVRVVELAEHGHGLVWSGDGGDHAGIAQRDVKHTARPEGHQARPST